MSRNHSDSSIIEITLKNGDNAFNMGEIVSGCLWENDICSCEHEIKYCPFWNRVKSKFEKDNIDFLIL